MFTRQMKKNKNTVTGSGYKKWIWFEELAFIDQFVKERMWQTKYDQYLFLIESFLLYL